MKTKSTQGNPGYHSLKTPVSSMTAKEIIELHDNAGKITDPSLRNPYAERLDTLADIMARRTIRELIAISGQENQRAQARGILRGYGYAKIRL